MKFSIITPSYNQGKFLGQTIESVISQEGDFAVEYIIADGGSTDNSIEIIKKYDKLAKNKKINYIWWSRKDKGQSDAINQGLKKASGDVVAWLNSDDYYLNGVFQKVLKEFKKNPDKIWLAGYCHIINDKNQEIQKYITEYKNWWLNHYSYNKLLITNFIRQPATFWRKDIIKTIGLLNENLNYSMDYDYWLRIGRKYEPMVYQGFLSNFRIHTQSKGKVTYIKQFNEDLMVVSEYTKNKLFLRLHIMHNWLVKLIYLIIK